MIGSRVIYRPVTMRRGIPQAPSPATVVKIYDEQHVLIKCDGEKIKRRVKINHLEVLSG